MSMEHINAIFWWTGSLVWLLIGGGIVMSVLGTFAMLIGALCWKYGMRMVRDVVGLNNVRLWVAAGRPKVPSQIVTTKSDIAKV